MYAVSKEGGALPSYTCLAFWGYSWKQSGKPTTQKVSAHQNTELFDKILSICDLCVFRD